MIGLSKQSQTSHGRLKPKKESTFGKVKKPFKGAKKNRKGSKKVSVLAEDREIKVDRIKPKFDGTNDTYVTILEQQFMDWLHEEEQFKYYACIVCGRKENYEDSIDWHHIKEASGDKKNHKKQIPACHNRCHILGKELSIHGTPVKFRQRFSWKRQNEIADSVFSRFILLMNYSEDEITRLDVKKDKEV